MRINAYPRFRRLFRLRTILMVVMLSVLFLPLLSIYFFRVYENELVQKTELELIAQSAVLSATYRSLLGRNQNTVDVSAMRRSYGNAAQPFFTPIEPSLDLSRHEILPRRPDALPSAQPISPQDWQAGNALQDIIISTQRVTLAGIRITDRHGSVIAGRDERGLSLAHLAEVQTALHGRYASVIRERISDEPPPPIASLSRGTGIRVFIAFPVVDQGEVLGVIYLSRTPQNIFKHLYAIKTKMLLLSLLLLGGTFLLVVFLSSRLSRPIRELTEQTRKVTSGEVETIEVLRQPGTYELAQLSNSFARMSHTLHERSLYIRQFASHVSHEFKTPLTSIQGALELIQDHADDMPAEQRQKFIDNVLDDTERLKKLVSRLLELARADSVQPTREICELLPILKSLVSSYQHRSIHIHYDQQQAKVKLKIAADAMKTILTNLLENSLQHGASKVTIDLSMPTADIVELRISDDGEGISAANRERIFTPFFTTRREQGGTGLGLGIVASLIKAWNGSIELGNSSAGVTFIINVNKFN